MFVVAQSSPWGHCHDVFFKTAFSLFDNDAIDRRVLNVEVRIYRFIEI